MTMCISVLCDLIDQDLVYACCFETWLTCLCSWGEDFASLVEVWNHGRWELDKRREEREREREFTLMYILHLWSFCCLQCHCNFHHYVRSFRLKLKAKLGRLGQLHVNSSFNLNHTSKYLTSVCGNIKETSRQVISYSVKLNSNGNV